MGPAELERHNPNLVGGDISGGEETLRQLFFRPAVRLNPYTTPVRGVYLCSSSTPPGGAVHGMCGFYAARTVLRGPLSILAPPVELGRRADSDH
jgi:phytoene dehydrogenase-like protein